MDHLFVSRQSAVAAFTHKIYSDIAPTTPRTRIVMTRTMTGVEAEGIKAPLHLEYYDLNKRGTAMNLQVCRAAAVCPGGIDKGISLASIRDAF